MRLPTVLVSENADVLEALDDRLIDLGDVEVVKKASTLEAATLATDEIQVPFLMVLNLTQDPDKLLRFAEALKTTRSDCHIVMTSPDRTPEIVLRAFRAGAEEFFGQPFVTEDILESVRRTVSKVQQRATTEERRGKIVTVFSSKGGVGTTTLATNLAVAIQTQPDRALSVCVVDLDLQFGSISTFFNIDVPYNIIDLAKNLDGADALFLEGALGKHGSGVRVLSEATVPSDANQVQAPHVERILELLTRSFDYVILDCGDQIDDVSGKAFHMSNLILLVTVMDIPSLQSTHKAMGFLDRMDVSPGKLRLIINRYAKNKFFKLESVAKVLGSQPFWVLPEDQALTTTALNQGISVTEAKPRSPLAKSYYGLGKAIVESLSAEKAAKTAGKRGILSRLAASFM